MATKTIRHDELQNGDICYRQGYAFRVTNIRILPISCAHTSAVWHREETCRDCKDQREERTVIRFDGINTDGKLTGTGYAIGTYGAYGDVPVTIDQD